MKASSDVYGNISKDDLYTARLNYTTAFLLYRQGYLKTTIELLDNALQSVPNFADAYYLREDVWHNYLKEAYRRPDRTSAYISYLKSKAWSAKREQVMERDGYKCVICKGPAQEVHHKTYENIGKEPLCDLSSVCKPCHTKLPPLYSQNRILSEKAVAGAPTINLEDEIPAITTPPSDDTDIETIILK